MDIQKQEALELGEDFEGGDASRFGMSISEVLIKGNDPTRFHQSGVTVVVGGNNAGKSTLLKEIRAVLAATPYGSAEKRILVDSIRVTRAGSADDAIEWFAQNADIEHKPPVMPMFRRVQEGRFFTIDVPTLRSYFTDPPYGLRNIDNLAQLGEMVSFLASSRARFDETKPVARRDDLGDPAVHPVHRLQDNRSLLDELNRALKYIFDVEVTLDSVSGSTGLRYGTSDVPAPPVDNITPEYRNALVALPHVATQGDGFVSAVGLLLPLIASTYPICLVDEPEAFLHPPQAYRLGRRLMELASTRAIQVIIATHDQNFLAGALSASSDDNPVTVLRLQRSGSETKVNKVEPEDIARTWTKPQLRFGNVLDGIFHDAVVVAENDRDCLFYEAAFSARFPEASERLMYTPCHGKGGAEELVSILRAASVPTVVVLDLDALNDKAFLKKIVLALGGQWTSDLENDWDVATAEFRQPQKTRTIGQVLASIDAAVGSDKSLPYTNDVRSAVSNELALDSPWKPIKKYGVAAFNAEHARAMQLIEKLKKIGLVLVEVGELEGFGRSVKERKGSGWVPAALDADVHLSEDAGKMAQKIKDAVDSVSAV